MAFLLAIFAGLAAGLISFFLLLRNKAILLSALFSSEL